MPEQGLDAGRLVQRVGVGVEQYGQGHRPRHPNHPALNAHVANAVARSTGRGWRLDEANRTVNIDGAVCLAMCVDRIEHVPAFEPVRALEWV